MATLEEIYKQTGKFGWFQIRMFFIICILSHLTSLLTFVQVFIGGEGDHWCKVGQWEAEGCKPAWNLTVDECARLMKNLSTPVFDDDDSRDPGCMKYAEAGNVSLEEAYASRAHYISPSDVISCDEGWNFDKSIYQSTITEDWGLVCEKSVVLNALQSIFLAGFLAGCVIFGTLADRIGRYYTLMVTVVASGILAAACAFSPNVVFYAVLRFLMASTSYGSILVGFVFITEMVVPETRVIVGAAIWYSYALAYFVLSGLARIVPSWRILMGIIACLYILLVPTLLWVTESPRWLLTKSRIKEATQVIARIARVNGKQPPTEQEVSKLCGQDVDVSQEQGGASVRELIRTPALMFYLLNLLFNWFVQSFVYFGLALGTAGLGVNVYVAFCISGAVEIPGYTMSIYSMKKLGRKVATASLMILAGVSCFGTIFAPSGPILLIVAMIGKFAITASFSNIYIHTAEIFPTPLRAMCVGTCSIAARVGGLIAPMVLFLEKFWKPLHLILFASSSVLAGVLVLLLPETKGKPMPDTIEESLQLRNIVKGQDPVDNDDNVKA